MRPATRSGWKSSRASCFSPTPTSLIGSAGDGAHRQRGAAAGVAVHAGHDDAGHADRVVERLGGVDRVLAGHRVDHQQSLGRIGGGADFLHLRHQRLVDREAAGGVEQHDVVTLAPGGIHRALGYLHRGLAGDDGQAGDARLLGQLLQLQLRGGPLGVEAGEQDLLLQPLPEAQREFAGGGGLAGALQADQQDRHRRGGVEVDRDGAGTAQLLDHLVVDDLDDLLAGRDGLQDLDADGAVADLGDEVAHHGQGDVGVQQREADFPQRLGDVHFVQRAPAAQAVEDAVELVGQSLEHDQTLLEAGMRDLKTTMRRCANPRGAAEPPRQAGTG